MSIKKAVKFINDFEEKALEVANTEGYDFVVCGHVHRAQMRTVGNVTYLNSGDWVESLTALEYNGGEWTLHQYNEADYPEEKPQNAPAKSIVDEDEQRMHQSHELILSQILNMKPTV